ncbi:PIF1-like helicase-domain-containing protein, partial [Mycena alexandri]
MNHNPTEESVYDYGLFLLNKLLLDSGRSLRDWPTMPLPQTDWDAEVMNPLIAEQLNYNREEERERAERQMNDLNLEQRAAFDKIIESARQRSGKTYFLNGPGGTGKTFVYKTACHLLRSEEQIVLCVASSGIAALILPGGRTSYSVFKIPIDGLNAESFCSIPKNSQRADLLRRTVLII